MYRKDVESGFCAIAHSEDWRPRDRKYQDALRKVPGADLSSQSAAPEPDHEGHAELRYSRVGNSLPFRKSSETSTKIIGKSFLPTIPPSIATIIASIDSECLRHSQTMSETLLTFN